MDVPGNYTNRSIYAGRLKKIVNTAREPPTFDDNQIVNDIDQLLTENSKMCSKYRLNDQLTREYKKLIKTWNANVPNYVPNTHLFQDGDTKHTTSSIEQLPSYDIVALEKNTNTLQRATISDSIGNNFNSINDNDFEINTMSSAKTKSTTRGRNRKEKHIDAESANTHSSRSLDIDDRNRCRVRHRRGKKIADDELSDGIQNSVSIGEDIPAINRADIEKIIPPRVEIIDDNLLSIQGYAIKKDGTKIDICTASVPNRLLFSMTINRERVDILTKLLLTAAIKSSKITKTVVMVVTKKAFYINIISYTQNTGAIVEVSPKILTLQRYIKIPLQSPIGIIRLACTSLENFNRCITRANDFKNGIAIDFYDDGIVAKSDWKMDTNKEAQKLTMVRLDRSNQLYGEESSNISLIPQTCSKDTSNCFRISLSEFRASMASLKKVLPKGAEEIVIGFYAMASLDEMVIVCNLGGNIKVPLATKATPVISHPINEGFIESITLSADGFTKIPLLTKSETIDAAFMFLRKNHDYFDFTYYTKLDVEINTRLPIIDFVVGEL